MPGREMAGRCPCPEFWYQYGTGSWNPETFILACGVWYGNLKKWMNRGHVIKNFVNLNDRPDSHSASDCRVKPKKKIEVPEFIFRWMAKEGRRNDQTRRTVYSNNGTSRRTRTRALYSQAS